MTLDCTVLTAITVQQGQASPTNTHAALEHILMTLISPRHPHVLHVQQSSHAIKEQTLSQILRYHAVQATTVRVELHIQHSTLVQQEHTLHSLTTIKLLSV
jgi:hypothetical protein